MTVSEGYHPNPLDQDLNDMMLADCLSLATGIPFWGI
jgi:hypothetical protein